MEPGMAIIVTLVKVGFAMLIVGWIPAIIAKKKGRNFLGWWVYGGALFIFALIHAILLKPRKVDFSEATTTCEKCGKTFESRNKLEVDTDQGYICKNCQSSDSSKSDKKDLDELLNEAKSCEEKKDYDRMASICIEATNAYPDTSEAHKLLGTAYAYQKKFINAVNALEKSIELDGNNADAYAMLGRTLLENGDHTAAIQPLEKAIELQPSHPEAEFKLGNVHFQLGNYDEAIRLYESYSKKYDFPWVFFNIGVSYHHIGDEDKAIEYVKIAADKGHPQAINLLNQMG